MRSRSACGDSNECAEIGAHHLRRNHAEMIVANAEIRAHNLRMYSWERKGWPAYEWEESSRLAVVKRRRSRFLEKMASLGLLRDEARLRVLTSEVINTAKIEGEIFDEQSVRSSVARRLGLDFAGLPAVARNVDGMVEVAVDATQNAEHRLTKKRLFAWHAALFPTGRSSMTEIAVGRFRDDEDGPMQIVSGGLGKEKVHFEAPPAKQLEEGMRDFIRWFNTAGLEADPLEKAAIAHLWFVTLHPFDDGNGRIARALTDLLLTRADGSTSRFYSFSAQLMKERNAYYRMLEAMGHGGLDITRWIDWFLRMLDEALLTSEELLAGILKRHDFWSRYESLVSARQRNILSLFLSDTGQGHLSSGKYAKLAKVSQDTATRDLQHLVELGAFQKRGDGRNTHYVIRTS